ncbi:Cof-type HAD-IIB family hydrolase [Bacteroides fluxus]
MIKALFFDIDGTLVSFHTHEIPPSAIEALAAAKAKGIHLFIATGRPGIIINNLTALQERNLIDGYITMNGGYCFVGEEVIYKSAIPATDVQALMQYCSGRNIPCIAVGEHDICVCQPNDQVKQIFHDFLKVDVLPVKTPEEAIQGREIFQMTPFITAEEEKEILPSIPNCEIGRWFPAFADITAKGNNKQKGIDEIIRHFNIRLEETVAFGDGGNDISMLRHAGIGVAMGNASDDVKAVADYITTTVDDDGIANALKQLIGES